MVSTAPLPEAPFPIILSFHKAHPVLHLKATSPLEAFPDHSPHELPDTHIRQCTPKPDRGPITLASKSNLAVCRTAAHSCTWVSEKAMGDLVELGAHICSDRGNSQQSTHTPVHNCQRPVTPFSADALARREIRK